MRCADLLLSMSWILPTYACSRGEDPLPPRDPTEDGRPEVLSGNSMDFGIGIKNRLVRKLSACVDTRFEVVNQGRSIVKVEAVPESAGSEVTLSVEVFRHGKWEREPTTTATSARFDDLWPHATEYARAVIPLDAVWARVVVRARDLVLVKDGTIVPGTVDVFSDAFNVPASE